MKTPLRKNTSANEHLLIKEWQERASEERRTDIDNRNGPDQSYFENGGKERRKLEERRHQEERRDGWLRVGQWRSESVFDHKK